MLLLNPASSFAPSPRCMCIRFIDIAQGEQQEAHALQLLIEDRTLTVMSYREFIQHIARATAP